MFEIVWSLVALYVGIFGIFFTQTFIEKNARAFEKLHRKTGISIFKKQAEGTRAPFNRFFTRIVCGFFLIFGILALFGFVSFGKQ